MLLRRHICYECALALTGCRTSPTNWMLRIRGKTTGEVTPVSVIYPVSAGSGPRPRAIFSNPYLSTRLTENAAANFQNHENSVRTQTGF